MGIVSSLLDKSIVFSFDRTGFNRHARDFRPGDLDVDLTGKVCLVTGASSGLGIAVTRGLAQRGATVHMLCRNIDKALRVREELVANANGPLHIGHVDLSDFASIRAFAESFDPVAIDVLVHNAGVLPATRVMTADGLELTAATNLVGPFLLTHLLWPKLHAARLVHVASGGMYSERLDVETLMNPPEPFDGVKAYARTKRAQVVLAEILSMRSSLAVSSMHPGWADTPGVESSLPRFHSLTKRILRSPEQGADTIVWLAASPAAAQPEGRFYFDRAPRDTHLSKKTRETPEERVTLWETLCRTIGADPDAHFR